MAHTGPAALLLLLVASTAYAADDALCSILNGTNISNNTSAFNLTVSPDTLTVNSSIYTVSLTGNGNATVVFQALSGSNHVGNWSENNASCSGGPLFANAFENGTIPKASWTSPQNLTAVNISVYIQDSNNTTYIIVKELKQAESTPTTAPTSNTTATTTTKATTTAPPTTTHNGVSSVQSSILTIVLLGMIAGTSKYLS